MLNSAINYVSIDCKKELLNVYNFCLLNCKNWFSRLVVKKQHDSHFTIVSLTLAMPSLTTNNELVAHRSDTFKCVVPQTLTETHATYTELFESMTFMLTFVILVWVGTLLVLVPYFLCVYQFYYHYSTFNTFGYDTSMQVCMTIGTCIIVYCTYRYYFIDHAITFKTVLLVYSVYQAPVYFEKIVVYYLSDELPSVYDFYVYLSETELALCDSKVFQCYNYNLITLYWIMGYLSFYPLICSVIIFFWCNTSCCGCCKKGSSPNNNTEQLQIELLSTDTNGHDQDINCDENELESFRLNVKLLKVFVIYFAMYGLFYPCVAALDSVQKDVYSNDWEKWYYTLLILMVFSKYIFKKVARLIDFIYVKMIKKTNTGYVYDDDGFDIQDSTDPIHFFLSFEWLNEMYFSVVYWRMYRFFVCFYAPSLSVFIFSIFLHLLSEIMESSVKISRLYYNKSSQIMDNTVGVLFKKSNVNCKFFQSGWVYDDSTFAQWQIRCSIDIVTRMFVSVISSLLQAVYAAIVGRKYYGNSVDTAQWYNLISLIIEMTYFAIAMTICYKSNEFNMIKPFQTVYQMHKKQMLVGWILAFYLWTI